MGLNTSNTPTILGEKYWTKSKGCYVVYSGPHENFSKNAGVRSKKRIKLDCGLVDQTFCERQLKINGPTIN